MAACAATCSLAACADATGGSGQGRYRPSSDGTASSAPSSAAGSAVPSSSSATRSKPAGKHAVPSHPVRTKTVVTHSGTSYVIKVWAEQKGVTDCAAHAYGAPVIKYLRKHPCFGLDRVLATTIVDGRAVGIAQRSIGFRGGMSQGYSAAGGFAKLVSKNGTGNLDDLMRDGYRLPDGPKSVPFPNAFSALGQDNNVTVVEAWYLKGKTADNDPALEKMCRDIFLQY